MKSIKFHSHRFLTAMLALAAVALMGTVALADPIIPVFDRPLVDDIHVLDHHFFPLWGMINWPEVSETPTEPNNDKDHALMVTDCQVMLGHVDAASDPNDYFKVVLTSQSSIFMKLTWESSAWLNVYVYNSDLTPVTYLNEDTPSPKDLCAWQYNAGTFYVRVRAAEGSSSYRLTIAVAGQTDEPGNDAIDTTSWQIGSTETPVRSVISATQDSVDFIQIAIPWGCKSAKVAIDWFGSDNANLDLTAYGPNGHVVSMSNASDTFETISGADLPSGIYTISVNAVSGRAVYQLGVEIDADPIIIDRPPFIERIPIWDPPYFEPPFDPGFDPDEMRPL